MELADSVCGVLRVAASIESIQCCSRTKRMRVFRAQMQSGEQNLICSGKSVAKLQ